MPNQILKEINLQNTPLIFRPQGPAGVYILRKYNAVTEPFRIIWCLLFLSITKSQITNLETTKYTQIYPSMWAHFILRKMPRCNGTFLYIPTIDGRQCKNHAVFM